MNDYIAQAFVIFLVAVYAALALVLVFAALKWWVWPFCKRRLPEKSRSQHPFPHLRERQ